MTSVLMFNLMKLNIDIQKKEGTDMKRTVVLTAALILVLMLMLTGCSKNSSDVHGRDLTAKLAVEYTVPDGAEIVEDLTYTRIEYA